MPPVDFARERAPTRRDLLIAAFLTAATFLLYHSLLSDLRDGLGNFSKYPLAAEQFAGGSLGAERALDFSPLYLRICIWLNAHAADPFLALVRLQCACVAAATGALFLALRRHVGGAVALLGAAAFALYPGLIAHAYVFEPEPLMVLWLTLLLLFAGGGRAASVVGAGVTLALCVFTRPGFWPLFAVFPAACALVPARKSAWRASAVFLGCLHGGVGGGFLHARTGAAVALDDESGDSYLRRQQPALRRGAGGIPRARRRTCGRLPRRQRLPARALSPRGPQKRDRDLTRNEANAWWASKALAYASDHPGAWARSVTRNY